jgi:membrane-associated phospholipid phosphatase
MQYLDRTDLLNIVFFVLLSAGMAVCPGTIEYWWAWILFNIGIAAAIALLARVESVKSRSTKSPIWSFLHGWYNMVCIPIAFKEMYYLVPALHPHDYDWLLIAIDHSIFGVNPTQWLARFAHPLLTEILQIAYSSYYLLPLVLGIDLYRRKRVYAFKRMFFTLILGFYLSYIGYVALPAVGPRFTLHDFAKLEEDLPGLMLTSPLRLYTNSGESISFTTPNAAAKVQRDVFPSGHTEITLLVIFLAFRYRARVRWYLCITGSLLIIATVFLRYHYVVDVIGGVAFMLLTIWLVDVLERLRLPWLTEADGNELNSRSTI